MLVLFSDFTCPSTLAVTIIVRQISYTNQLFEVTPRHQSLPSHLKCVILKNGCNPFRLYTIKFAFPFFVRQFRMGVSGASCCHTLYDPSCTIYFAFLSPRHRTIGANCFVHLYTQMCTINFAFSELSCVIATSCRNCLQTRTSFRFFFSIRRRTPHKKLVSIHTHPLLIAAFSCWLLISS